MLIQVFLSLRHIFKQRPILLLYILMSFKEDVALFDSDSFQNRKMSDRQTWSALSALQVIFTII